MDPAVVNILSDIQYTLAAFAATATLGRFYIRWRYSKLGWDDLFNGIAFACLLTYTVLPGTSSTDESDYWADDLVVQFMIWTSLWCVKASFLALCWTIFNISNNFRRAWWAVTTYTALSYWPVVLPHLWQCGKPSEMVNPGTCTSFQSTPSNMEGIFLALAAVEAALHISSELAILALPLIFIRQLQMSKAQKISAAGIFGVVIITILTGSLRTIAYVCYDLDFNADASRTIQLSMEVVEAPLAVLVCTLPAYKVLLSKFLKRRKEKAERLQNAEDIQKLMAEMRQLKSDVQKVAAELKIKKQHTVRARDSIAELEMV